MIEIGQEVVPVAPPRTLAQDLEQLQALGVSDQRLVVLAELRVAELEATLQALILVVCTHVDVDPSKIYQQPRGEA